MFVLTAKLLDPPTQNHCLNKTIQRLAHFLFPHTPLVYTCIKSTSAPPPHLPLPLSPPLFVSVCLPACLLACACIIYIHLSFELGLIMAYGFITLVKVLNAVWELQRELLQTPWLLLISLLFSCTFALTSSLPCAIISNTLPLSPPPFLFISASN